MGFYDDISNAGNQFTASFGKDFANLGKTMDKFLDFGNLQKMFNPLSESNAQKQQPFDASPLSMNQQNPWSPTSGGSEITSRFRPTIGEYNGNDFLNQMNQAIWEKKGAQLGQNTSTGGDTSVGSLSPGVDAWNTQIQAASVKYGAPANLMKAIMNMESGGVNLKRNGAGAIGPMQIVDIYHQADMQRMGLDINNPNDNIMYASYLLNQNYQQCGNWEGAVAAYYSGHCAATGAGDNPSEGGSGISVSGYVKNIIDTWHNLNGTTQRNSGVAPGATGVGLSSFTGGQTFGISQELGPGAFANGNPDYAYGAAYGVSGHPGIDVATPRGTTLTTPWSGVVVCVGGSSYGNDLGGGGCGAYDDDGHGPGRIQIRLDNGDHMIWGHTGSTNLRPGQRVNAGDVIGTSGSAGTGAHVHLEYRKKTGQNSSGFTVVDPRTMTSGTTTFSSGTNIGTNNVGSFGNAWGGSGYDPYKRSLVR